MKIKSILTLIVIIAFAGVISSCKKVQNGPNVPSLQLTEQDSGKTITVSPGEILQLTLGDPGDGGYTFDPLQYDSSVLSLKDHTLSLPKNTNIIGDFGSDTWEFSALRTGTTALTITATRGSDKTSTLVIFTGTIAVK
jgi:predicted secreted protein